MRPRAPPRRRWQRWASILAGREAIHTWIEQLVVARRALQGIAVRDGEIAFMQAVVPTGILVLAAALVVVLFFVERRLDRGGRTP